MSAVDLEQRLRAATMRTDWNNLPDDACIPAVPLLREAADALAVKDTALAQCMSERDEAIFGYKHQRELKDHARKCCDTTEAALAEMRVELERARISANDLLVSLDPETLNPEQFNAWSALSSQAGGDTKWQPTHRHVKRGSEYQVVGIAEVQVSSGDGLTEAELTIVYRGKDGKLWVRRKPEFEDGRFEALAARALGRTSLKDGEAGR